MTLGEKLNKYFQVHGLKQGKLADATGASRATVSTWFLGQRPPAHAYMVVIKDMTGVSLDWWMDDRLGWDDMPDPSKPKDNDAKQLADKVRAAIDRMEDADLLRILAAGIQSGRPKIADKNQRTVDKNLR